MLSKKVVLATDHSEAAKKLINCLDELKILGIEEVILTYVLDVQPSKILNFDKIIESNEKRLHLAKEQIEDKGFNVKIKIPVGSPAVEIDRVADDESADLILIASHGKGFIKKVFLGSTTYNLIRQSKKSILIEKYEIVDDEARVACARKFNRILIPVDFSDDSMSVINLVKELKEKAEEIILLNVIESSRFFDSLKEARENAEKKLNEIAGELKESDITEKVTIKIEEGAASENIINIAESEDVGLIIMAKRGRGNIKELILGSTSDRVAKESPSPVLLVSNQ
ncbi:universal stress protein [Halanaerobiaceae bacterium Z-7014]|uniref:Universal stress protein n=1 Tax=Halonatronomonas betaini TaxID=2778430 RepID=A0A931APV7_9FIRM|nr:universal stress protein [Halonatronomonas betaini]MBF8436292.1 universal stress protein [Halonatronomonas betaini]